MEREYYSSSISHFLKADPDSILGALARASEFPVEQAQTEAWIAEIGILNGVLKPYEGAVHFEYSIPRMGKRIDVVALIGSVIFVLEFKVGAREFAAGAIDQVWDYALDLKNFHEPSHHSLIAPILIATEAIGGGTIPKESVHKDGVLVPMRAGVRSLPDVLADTLRVPSGPNIDVEGWARGRYKPTPTIIEAATALYGGHSVAEISRSDASAINLSATSSAISSIVEDSRRKARKSICFVTGVPGAGKTLVGLNVATKYSAHNEDLYSVYLSGNGPLVTVLREALARDKVLRERERGLRIRKGVALSEVRAFIQNIHHFRDEALLAPSAPPVEHVALFDEAQRAWNIEQTANFMRRKRGQFGFDQSEPEFLISCMDRHPDWAVVVCLVGGGQEINTGEAGIGEWIEALERSFPDWAVHMSSRLTDSEYAAGEALDRIRNHKNVSYADELHLGVSMRSFRAENVSLLVKQVLDLELNEATTTLGNIGNRYPIVLTRDLRAAKGWVREQARGSERYGLIVSSQAERLKPHAIDVKSPIDPIHWFLDGKEDVRSSYYLEDVATEFHIQGLELDWSCVTWDADLRRNHDGWEHWSFVGDRWQHVKKADRQNYLKNAYRVLLTRARQGMVIVVPEGSTEDPTRKKEFYDPTFRYLRDVGFPVL